MYIETDNIGILIILEVFQEDLKFKILYTLNIPFINEVYTLKQDI